MISKLLPHTSNPLLLDCYGKNSLDWASVLPSTFERMGHWVESFAATDNLAQRSQVRKNIVALTTELLAAKSQDSFVFNFLGRCLLIMEDSNRAEFAFQLNTAERVGDGPLEYDIVCSFCKPPANIKGELFVCLVCAEKFLCSNCMDKYRAGSAQLRGCVSHRYHQVTGRKWTGSSDSAPRFMNEKGQTSDEWLLETKLMFSSS